MGRKTGCRRADEETLAGEMPGICPVGVMMGVVVGLVMFGNTGGNVAVPGTPPGRGEDVVVVGARMGFGTVVGGVGIGTGTGTGTDEVVGGGGICRTGDGDEVDPDVAWYTQLPELGFTLVVMAVPLKSQL